jgi:hypothetical protein
MLHRALVASSCCVRPHTSRRVRMSPLSSLGLEDMAAPSINADPSSCATHLSPAFSDIGLRRHSGALSVEAGIAVWLWPRGGNCSGYAARLVNRGRVDLASAYWARLVEPMPAIVPNRRWIGNRDELRRDREARAIARRWLRANVLDPGLEARCPYRVSLDEFGQRFVAALGRAGVQPSLPLRVCSYCATPFRGEGKKSKVKRCLACRKHAHELGPLHLVAIADGSRGTRSWEAWCAGCGTQFATTHYGRRHCDRCREDAERQRRSRERP